ncbi:MAG TPA: fumarylacetoacetate hydrolase family protein [Vicinamibacterales bacterium]|nr:fumarylacetoacetate hydrolase family protein [Vicinamibacterales bacterium]
MSLARELMDAYANRHMLQAPLSDRDPSFDLTSAYAVEAELVRLRQMSGRITVGRKVGYANKAVWRALKLETLVWAHMYDDTVQYAPANEAALDITRMSSPKIEPEIVFKMRRPLSGAEDAAGALAAVEWIALGFEIIDCVYPDWKFQPTDFVASFGLHAALIVGEPLPVEPAIIPKLAEQLVQFKVRLTKNGEPVAEGSGKNSLRSPALCLAELASAISRRMPDEPLAGGELVSSGTLTESQSIAAGESWTATVDGIGLASLTLRLTA